MTKKKFNEKYPEGLNLEVARFSKALDTIMRGEEIDNIIAHAKGRERKWLLDYKKAYLKFSEDWDMPIWMMLADIESTILFRDIIVYMVASEDTIYRGENEADE